jgi:hypothetical protein
MDQPNNNQNVTVVTQGSNGLGTAGFVLSLLGIVTCGFTSIFGFILSFAGLFKEPRGLAIAGLILGIPGGVFFAIAGMTMVLGFVGLGAAAHEVANLAELNQTVDALVVEIEDARAIDGSLSTEKLSVIVSKSKDPWGSRLVAERDGDCIRIISAGFDTKIGTNDDIVRIHKLNGTKMQNAPESK